MNAEYYEKAMKHGKEIWVMEPVKGGTLAQIPEEDWKINPAYMQMSQRGFGKASDCIACGKCEKMCPQKIAIRQWMKDVKEALEW